MKRHIFNWKLKTKCTGMAMLNKSQFRVLGVCWMFWGMLLLASCSNTSTLASTPTPDAPKLAPGEATALVKKYLAGRSVIGSPSGMKCDFVFISSSFNETYDGEGVWTVKSNNPFGEGPLSWKVYEFSLVVAAAHDEIDSGGC